MGRKQKLGRSITSAVVDTTKRKRSLLRRVLRLLKALFTLYSVQLHQHRQDIFSNLRHKWYIDDDTYRSSFDPHDALRKKGHMGYSGSTFFTTSDERYLIKSVPRHFENSFFKEDLLQPYEEYMISHVSSLLVRITDFLAADDVYKISPGILLGLAPSHHIIMENLLFGRDESEAKAKEALERYRNGSSAYASETVKEEQWKWETWDLKPTTYFFPERDIASGKLASEATKSRLADEFNDKLVLTAEQAKTFMNQLRQDTDLLREANAVDYSLFLVRIPKSKVVGIDQTKSQQDEPQNPFTDDAHPENDVSNPIADTTAPEPTTHPFAPPTPPTWRTGIESADGNYVYRAVILDFFWAKHKVRAKLMTALVNIWNKINLGGDKGPMSITTSSSEYQGRFLGMCEGFIEVEDVGEEADDS
ncbi:hypothetical protein H2198_008396 [Neophaeococcomyces mojaviensis]|uniref:Uncharacterized protein n=1 Tax=Neophaeococcomyces mojaviensis TaxID=3383035 RepID=A0ACC2ZY29_9EURO|nr:hypothetical protein H2198_008396 [Knufia sp. JES_112]